MFMTQVNSVLLSANAPKDSVGKVSRSETESTASVPTLRKMIPSTGESTQAMDKRLTQKSRAKPK